MRQKALFFRSVFRRRTQVMSIVVIYDKVGRKMKMTQRRIEFGRFGFELGIRVLYLLNAR